MDMQRRGSYVRTIDDGMVTIKGPFDAVSLDEAIQGPNSASSLPLMISCAIAMACGIVITVVAVAIISFSHAPAFGNYNENMTKCRLLALELFPQSSMHYTSHFPSGDEFTLVINQSNTSFIIISPMFMQNTSEDINLSKVAELVAYSFFDKTTHLINSTSLQENLLFANDFSENWTGDNTSFYFGSRNLVSDKDLAIVGINCPVFYQMLRDSTSLLNDQYTMQNIHIYNRSNPYSGIIQNISTNLFFTHSLPNQTSNSNSDLNAIISLIQSAQVFIHIAVTKFLPLTKTSETSYFPVIMDQILLAAIDRGVKIKLLILSETVNTFLKALVHMGNLTNVSIEIKYLKKSPNMPSNSNIKTNFLVTEAAIYLGRLAWEGNELLNSKSIGIVVQQDYNIDYSITQQLESIFQSHWNANYSQFLKH